MTKKLIFVVTSMVLLCGGIAFSSIRSGKCKHGGCSCKHYSSAHNGGKCVCGHWDYVHNR